MESTKMFYRTLSIAAVAATMFVSSPVWAKDAKDVTHDGKFIKLVGDKLEMSDSRGKEHSHMLAANAKVMCDGKECKAADLKPGMKIRVTTSSDDKKVATHVEAIDKNELFANTHEGKFVSLSGHKLQMTDTKGKEHSHTLAKDATFTCDGASCKAEHLKAGMKIRVMTDKSDKNVVTHIDAVEKNPEF